MIAKSLIWAIITFLINSGVSYSTGMQLPSSAEIVALILAVYSLVFYVALSLNKD